MITLEHLAKFILELQPNKDPARLALYHFVLHKGPRSEPLKSKLFSEFVEFCLLHEHWQKNRPHLQSEMEMCLQGFAETHKVRFDWENILWPSENQVVQIEDPQQIRYLVQQSTEALELGPEQHKILLNRDKEVTTISFHKDKGVHVRVYPNLARIHNGKLIPIVGQSLRYNQHLSFLSEAPQVVKTDKHSYALFKFTDRGCEGKLLRGYTFQKSFVFDGGELNRYPMIFYPVKRLEQTFINRKTDPMYAELIHAMEKSILLIRQGHPEAYRYALASYERGRLAFHEIFPDDKVFGILLNSLEILLESKGHQASPAEFRA